MGISADIIQCKEEIDMLCDLVKHNTKTIASIGGSYYFKDNVLEDYNKNLGYFTFKEGWDYIIKEEQEVLKHHLEDKYSTKIEYLLERTDWFITLNY